VTDDRIIVELAPLPPIAARRFEICEHKGLGHPDTLTDGACEAAAMALAGAYRRAFGGSMHFNVDKGLLVGGRSSPRFGGGELLVPPKLVICGRAAEPDGRFRVEAVAAEAARTFLRHTLRRAGEAFRIECEIRPGSASLQALYRGGAAPNANDTSIGVGFWPYSPLEHVVLETAALLGSHTLRTLFPAAGDDFKVMGVRRDGAIALTVALALVDCEVHSVAQYFKIKRALADWLTGRVDVRPEINTLDHTTATAEEGLYLTVTGSSAEMGDDGQVGRGNRINGLITPARVMSLEAAAGKNPAGHVGKVYNVLAHHIARAVCEGVPDISEASVQLVSQIGRPLTEPWAAYVQVVASAPLSAARSEEVRAVTASHLDRASELARRIEAEGIRLA
jgi:S-adenosylmethionine synthetase